jgi:hypothetical protein
MYGGLGYRKFYLTEIDRIESEHQSRLPESRLTSKEVQAGFQRLGTAYGPLLSIFNIEERTSYKEDEILTWPLSRFYNRIEIYAWQAHTQKKYQELMAPKDKKGKR